MDVVVTGIGLQSCLGFLSQSWAGILASKSGIAMQQPFPELPTYPLGLINDTPSQLSPLTKLIVKAAISDANLQTPLPECGVAIGSSRGCQNIWEKIITSNFNLDCSRPLVFPSPRQSLPHTLDILSINWLNILPHQSAVSAARIIETTAPVLSPMAACATGIFAIARGSELIQTGECQRVIAGAVETPVTKLSLAGFARMGALAKTGCYPFDRDREGLVLGEGGAVFVLETAELARSRGAKIYGVVKGFGLTCDASSTTAPTGTSSAIAIKSCLQRSNLTPNDIGYIHAHGTSTKLNDSHEAKLIQHLFNHSVAISSTKGATGHTLGASGAMGVAWCLMALRSGYLPPCVGLRELDFGINVVREAQQQKINNALCFSFGFGGQNAVLAVGKSIQ
ncbi:3-oxoacyl-(Acyl-carrier-protein) synthase [Hyella patelloides LEGE 07179]|uniref:3-oxoacyl-(Acyl-carrier-protein) synthase n=1 Tax=Hyella patelloides LEGE 07179 TaxID=945734 RepID=A0A563VYW1_9CYAN|nr:beta-ketoacyl-ACP synthase [Hyella patelloides]VEP16621.1 3-oxoacyl-(Acyl-carrier-protein) synthase [Hyella patelloides LEGE 07179]